VQRHAPAGLATRKGREPRRSCNRAARKKAHAAPPRRKAAGLPGPVRGGSPRAFRPPRHRAPGPGPRRERFSRDNTRWPGKNRPPANTFGGAGGPEAVSFFRSKLRKPMASQGQGAFTGEGSGRQDRIEVVEVLGDTAEAEGGSRGGPPRRPPRAVRPGPCRAPAIRPRAPRRWAEKHEETESEHHGSSRQETRCDGRASK